MSAHASGRTELLVLVAAGLVAMAGLRAMHLAADGAPLAYREGAADGDSDGAIARLDKLAGRSRPADSGP
ncbi:MAG: hypothetical protein JO223_11610 [Hyphomicrobiales bacterium]|nr:hypothetical protein [Hyphomicrobiales bacterium]MBV8442661.1 hypothetical protein [Hyphomicrobiales bacterium]